jgi:hypothetical protein
VTSPIREKESIRRSREDTRVTRVRLTLDWPADWTSWEKLPRRTRRAIRRHIDAAIDVIELAAAPHADQAR